MPAPLALPRTSWGTPGARRRALLVHGLGSTGALMWRFGARLADAGWHATAVDLRGHGAAPRALDYTIAAYAADLGHTQPDGGGPWDLVIGHSLGGAASVVASAADAGWTRHLVLVDPAVALDDATRADVAVSTRAGLAATTQAAVRAANPGWHEHDVELKVRANVLASAWAIEQTGAQNDPWNVRADFARLRVPSLVLASDPEVESIFGEEDAAHAAASVRVTRIAGADHSPHRSAPEQTLRALDAALTAWFDDES